MSGGRTVKSIAYATIKRALAAALLLSSIGCGSASSPTAPSPSPTALAGASEPIPAGSIMVPAADGSVPGVYRADVVMSRGGTARVTLQWPNGDYSLQLYVTSGMCINLTGLLTGMCTILGRTRPGDRPGVVVSSVTSGDVDTIWVLNPDRDPQPFTVDTTIE
jgi:hypothetical protein